jgi:hypothetical protein
MSAIFLPSFASPKTRRVVTAALIAEPRLTRYLDAPGLLTALCLRAQRLRGEDARRTYLAAHAGLPHRELVERLGLPPLRVLRHMVGDALNGRCFAGLRRLGDDRLAARILRHAPRVSAALILALDSPLIRAHTTTQFFAELGRTPRRQRPRPEHLGELAAFLAEYRPTVQLTSISHFRKTLRRDADLLGTERWGRRDRPIFPGPPWPGEPGYAEPLRTWRELVHESIAMRHCLGYQMPIFERIQQGTYYVYRVEQAWGLQRATMCLEKREGRWIIETLRGRNNAWLRSQEVDCLSVWVAEQQGIVDETACVLAGRRDEW